MKRITLFLSIYLALIGLLSNCKDTYQDFSPGAGDPRLVGTWQLAERRFPKDSTISTININYDIIIVGKQQIKIARDSTVTTRDTSFYATRFYSNALRQTLSFSADGKLTAEGSEMSYYNPIKFYRVDSTYQEGLGVNLYINTNRANQYFRQGVAFEGEMLVLKPKCEGNCYLKFSRVR